MHKHPKGRPVPATMLPSTVNMKMSPSWAESLFLSISPSLSLLSSASKHGLHPTKNNASHSSLLQVWRPGFVQSEASELTAFDMYKPLLRPDGFKYGRSDSQSLSNLVAGILFHVKMPPLKLPTSSCPPEHWSFGPLPAQSQHVQSSSSEANETLKKNQVAWTNSKFFMGAKVAYTSQIWDKNAHNLNSGQVKTYTLQGARARACIPGSARHAPGRKFRKETWFIGVHGELERRKLK